MGANHPSTEGRAASRDRRIARFAERQHGNVSREQLRACGLTEGALRYWLSIGRLHRVHRSVYRIGPDLRSHRAASFAAWLAADREPLVAGRSAAMAWGFCSDYDGEVRLLVTGTIRRRHQPGFSIGSFAAFSPADRRSRDGLPLTSPALTILDCAADLSTRELERYLSEARARNLIRPSHFRELRRRAPKRRGWEALGALLADEAAPEFTREEAESRALELIKRVGLPAPRRNFQIGRYFADFYWPELRLVLEIDGFGSHGGRSAFEYDRERDDYLGKLGIDVRHYSWRQATVLAEETIDQLGRYVDHRAAAFGLEGWKRTPRDV